MNMHYAFALLVLGLATSCGDKVDPVKDSCGTTGSIGYDQNIGPLTRDNCTVCHSAQGTGQIPLLETYQQVVDNATKAAARVSAGTMPPTGALSAANKCLFSAWVTQGMSK